MSKELVPTGTYEEGLVPTAYEGHQNLKVTCYSSGFCPTPLEIREDLIGSNTDCALKARAAINNGHAAFGIGLKQTICTDF